MDVENCIKQYGLAEVNNGTLQGKSISSSYRILNGHCMYLANEADLSWAVFYSGLFNKIISMNKSLEETKEIANSIIMQDSHWNWLKKSAALCPPEYEWFYLVADDKIQAICLIYHPKGALIEAGNIFYIEYVAVAPWNRSSKLNDKIYEKIGTKLIRAASEYACQSLKLKPGFSLHSLPQSESYYLHLGMVEVPVQKKDNLKYYEMNEETNNKWRISND